jgi:hypothetical protein
VSPDVDETLIVFDLVCVRVTLIAVIFFEDVAVAIVLLAVFFMVVLVTELSVAEELKVTVFTILLAAMPLVFVMRV